jgi:tol-pal system protein YbgF
MITRAICASAAAVLALGLAGAALAEKKPEDPVEKRFQSIEKQVKQLREIVLQAKDTGQPVQVRVSSEPDPTLEALSNRVDDLEQAAKTRNDQIDTLTHELETARKADADDKAQIKALEDRLAKAEGELKSLADAQAAAQAQQAQAQAVISGSPPPAAGVPPPPPPPAADSGDAFKRAMQVLKQGDNVAGAAALEAFVETYGDSPQGPEARYWLGDAQFARGLYQDAAAAYIGAIRGWPQTPWAPSAVVKLARALVALNMPSDACHTLDELKRRYPAASPGVRTQAQNVRAAAKCAA